MKGNAQSLILYVALCFIFYSVIIQKIGNRFARLQFFTCNVHFEKRFLFQTFISYKVKKKKIPDVITTLFFYLKHVKIKSTGR